MPSIKKYGFCNLKYTACLAALALCLASAAPESAFAVGFVVGNGGSGGAGGTGGYAGGADNSSSSSDGFGNTTGRITTAPGSFSASPGTAKPDFKYGSKSLTGGHGSYFNKGGGSAKGCFSGQKC